MRRLFFGALLLAGCQDYDKLKEDFCTTARIHHSATSTAAVALCDDFETSVVDPAKWQAQELVGGTITPEYLDKSFDFDTALQGTPDHAYRGKGVIHMSAGPSQVAELVDTSITPTQTAPAVRFFLWPGRTPSAGSIDVVELRDAENMPIRTVSLENGAFAITDAATGTKQVSPLQIFTDYWSCVEMNSYADHVDVIVDRHLDSEIDVTLGPLATPPQAMSTHVGAARRGTDTLPTTDLWFDEVIIDSDASGPSRSIGCTL